MISLSQILSCLFILMILFMGILTGCVIWFAIKCYRLRQKVKESIAFVDEYYIQKGKNPPSMILRIQKEIIQDYNKLVSNWMGSLFHIKHYPIGEEVSDVKQDRIER